MVNTTLKEVCTKIGSGATPKGGKEVYSKKGIALIRSQNVRDFNFSYDGLVFINDEQAEKLKNVILEKDDILLNITGDSVARTCKVDNRVLPARVNQHVAIIRPDSSNLLPSYLLYFLQMKKRHLLSIAGGGATRNALTKEMIEDIEIELPNTSYQSKVTNILDSIQKKISINNQINRNLEEQAKTLFHENFIAFTPYKENLVKVGSRSIPKGWSIVSLNDVCSKITDGSHFSPKDSPKSIYPMFSVKDMGKYGFNDTNCKHISLDDFLKMQKNDCVPKVNDILVAKDGSYLKEIFICNEQRDEAILSSIAIFRPDVEIINPDILLNLLKHPSVMKDVKDNYVSGSALPRIVLKDFKKFTFVLPPMSEQIKIAPQLETYRMQIANNIEENKRLQLCLDTLLPKLMSGELEVSRLNI